MPSTKKKVRTSAKKKSKANKMKGAEDSSSLSSQMQRMQVGGRRNGNSDRCDHGMDIFKGGIHCVSFVQKWLQGYNDAIDKVGNMEIAFKITQAVSTKEDAVWGSSESIDWVVSYFLMTATKQFLNGNIDMAGVDASYAEFFEQHKAVELSKTKPKIDWYEVVRIHNADKPTLAAFLKERISCTCLD
eukprot:scaffold3767_cov116-Skeletonema_menzelii.AAC.7